MPLLAANKLFPWISPFLACLLTMSWLISRAAKFMPEAGGGFVWGWRKIWSSVKFSGPDGATWFVCLCQCAIHHNYLCADVSFDWTLMCWTLQTRKEPDRYRSMATMPHKQMSLWCGDSLCKVFPKVHCMKPGECFDTFYKQNQNQHRQTDCSVRKQTSLEEPKATFRSVRWMFSIRWRLNCCPSL